MGGEGRGHRGRDQLLVGGRGGGIGGEISYWWGGGGALSSYKRSLQQWRAIEAVLVPGLRKKKKSE